MIWVALMCLASWGVLYGLRADFWRIEAWSPVADPTQWPEIVAVIPARDEEGGIGTTLSSLLAQDYPGAFRVIVVDDHSTDSTAEIVTEAALVYQGRVDLVSGEALPEGWTGKVWAMEQGLRRAKELAPDAKYILFTDADIQHAEGQLRALAARAEAEQRDMVSLMVRLNCETLPERVLIPAFVYFFRMLFPFAAVANPGARVAAAAGGVMMVRRQILDDVGGMAVIKGALIDDCSLASAIKHGRMGRLWLGLADKTRSLRVYRGWDEPWNMIARSAYDQLNRSPVLLAGTVVGLAVIFLAPVLMALMGGLWTLVGVVAWALMSITYLPMVRFYGQSPIWALALPGIACLYLGATLHSAWRYHRGQGGQWKGRVEGGRTGQ